MKVCIIVPSARKIRWNQSPYIIHILPSLQSTAVNKLLERFVIRFPKHLGQSYYHVQSKEERSGCVEKGHGQKSSQAH